MPYRTIPFVTNYFYHVYNRGVEKRKIFTIPRDYQRFLQTLYYYQFSGPKPKFSTHMRFRIKDFHKNPKIIEIASYCLMPNHFHFLIRQCVDGGIQEFIRNIVNSYTKYFNTKNRRVGPLLQGPFKATFIETDEQFLHVSRYIHLNPYVADITKDIKEYPYSSYPYFLDIKKDAIATKDLVLAHFKNLKDYEAFVNDHAGYAIELENIKHLLIDTE